MKTKQELEEIVRRMSPYERAIWARRLHEARSEAEFNAIVERMCQEAEDGDEEDHVSTYAKEVVLNLLVKDVE